MFIAFTFLIASGLATLEVVSDTRLAWTGISKSHVDYVPSSRQPTRT
jgi:hypothetical protein